MSFSQSAPAYRHTSLDKPAGCPSTIIMSTKHVHIAFFAFVFSCFFSFSKTIIKRLGCVQLEALVGTTHAHYAVCSVGLNGRSCLARSKRSVNYHPRSRLSLPWAKVALYVPCSLWLSMCPAGCGPPRALLAVALHVPCWLWTCSLWHCTCPLRCGPVCALLAVTLHVPCSLRPSMCPARCGLVCALLAVALYVPCWLWPCMCPAHCGPVCALMAVDLYVPCWLWPCMYPAHCGPPCAMFAVDLYVPCWLWPSMCPADCGPPCALLAVALHVPCSLLAVALHVPCSLWPCMCALYVCPARCGHPGHSASAAFLPWGSCGKSLHRPPRVHRERG